MKVTLLRAATKREIGYREWKVQFPGSDMLYPRKPRIWYGVDRFLPADNSSHWFGWQLHPHRGGVGALRVNNWKPEIRERVYNMIRFQERFKHE